MWAEAMLPNMSQEAKQDSSVLPAIVLIGAVLIGIPFLSIASEFMDSGISPHHALPFFLPICGVFLAVILLAQFLGSLSSPNHIQRKQK